MPDDQTLTSVTDRVRRLLVAADFKTELNGENGFVIPFGEYVAVFLDVEEQRSDDGEFVRFPIECWAAVLRDVTVTPDVLEYLAFPPVFTWGGITSMRNDDGTALIVFRNVLLGDFLDEKELTNTVATVASTADALIEELHPRFGGKRLGEE